MFHTYNISHFISGFHLEKKKKEMITLFLHNYSLPKEGWSVLIHPPSTSKQKTATKTNICLRKDLRIQIDANGTESHTHSQNSNFSCFFFSSCSNWKPSNFIVLNEKLLYIFFDRIQISQYIFIVPEHNLALTSREFLYRRLRRRGR